MAPRLVPSFHLRPSRVGRMAFAVFTDEDCLELIAKFTTVGVLETLTVAYNLALTPMRRLSQTPWPRSTS